MVHCFISTRCSYLLLTASLWISVVCIDEFEWKRDYELDDRTVTSHMISCHDVTTVTECLKDCSSLKLCHSVFVYKPNMSCCLNKMRMYTASTSQAAPGHVYYVSSYVAEKKATMSSRTAASETTTEDITNPSVAPISSTDDDEATTELTSTADVITTEATTATTTTPPETTALVTTAWTATTEATANVLNNGFINVPSIQLTFRASSDGLTWKDARANCEENSTHLIYLNTAAKQSYITDHLTETGISAEFYIGAVLESGVMKWLDGTEIMNPPWAPNEPPNKAKGISMIIPSGKWKGDDGKLIRQFICEP